MRLMTGKRAGPLLELMRRYGRVLVLLGCAHGGYR